MSRPTLPLRAALVLLLALASAAAPLRAAGFHAASPAPSFWGSLWETLVRAACSHGVVLDPGGCPSPGSASGCDKGPAIDPDGRCTAAAAPACPGGTAPAGDGRCIPREPALLTCDRGPAIDPNGGGCQQ